MKSVRILEMPACKMVSSGIAMFGEGNFNIFDERLSSQKKGYFQKISYIGQERALFGCQHNLPFVGVLHIKKNR